jgi:parallel beta-helix repeat protein
MDNLVNGKPIYFIKNRQNVDIDGVQAGQVIVVNSSNVNVANLQISNTDTGIQMSYVDNSTIAHNSISDSAYGIGLRKSDNLTLEWNDVTNHYFTGIYGDQAYDVILSNNTISSNGRFGIELMANRLTMIDNTIASNGGREYGPWDGVRVWGGSQATFLRNKVSSNQGMGINLAFTDSATFKANEFTSDGIGIYMGWTDLYMNYEITTDNLVNGKPVYYYKDCSGLDIDGWQVGQLILAGCSDVMISNLSITDTDYGISLHRVDDVSVTSSNVSDNLDGIYVSYSDNVIITGTTVFNNSANGISIVESNSVTLKGNNISFNQYNGVYLSYSGFIDVKGNNISSNGEGSVNVHGSDNATSWGNMFFGNGIGFLMDFGRDNLVHSNLFMENAVQAVDNAGSLNRWNGTYNFGPGGNFWSDYSGPDQCKGPNQDDCTGWDGFGDVPFIIDGDSQDNYPLILPGAVPALDNWPPTVTITYPSDGQTLTSSPVTVTGTAYDEGVTEIVKVEVRANNGSWIVASGTEVWSAVVDLQAGQNRIEARSWESGERSSLIERVDIFYDPPGNDRPWASFTIMPETGEVNSNFTANASSSWDYEDPGTSLEVRWDTNNDGNWETTWSTSKVLVFSYTQPGTYTIQLEVRDTQGLTNSTAEAITVVPDGRPESPANITVGVGAECESLIVTWTPSISEDVASYKILRSEDGVLYQLIAEVDSSIQSYIDSNLEANKTYWYEVVAIDHGGNESGPTIGKPSETTEACSVQEESLPWLYISAALVLVILAVLVMLLLFLKRKRIPAEAPTEEDETQEDSESDDQTISASRDYSL